MKLAIDIFSFVVSSGCTIWCAVRIICWVLNSTRKPAPKYQPLLDTRFASCIPDTTGTPDSHYAWCPDPGLRAMLEANAWEGPSARHGGWSVVYDPAHPLVSTCVDKAGRILVVCRYADDAECARLRDIQRAASTSAAAV